MKDIIGSFLIKPTFMTGKRNNVLSVWLFLWPKMQELEITCGSPVANICGFSNTPGKAILSLGKLVYCWFQVVVVTGAYGSEILEKNALWWGFEYLNEGIACKEQNLKALWHCYDQINDKWNWLE